ncbi:MAG: hypothetical protein ABIP48_30765, partial [Planctomycetota bacterium]
RKRKKYLTDDNATPFAVLGGPNPSNDETKKRENPLLSLFRFVVPDSEILKTECRSTTTKRKNEETPTSR